MNETQPYSNVPEFSVSELAFSLKRTLESNYGRVRVRGELSRVKIHTSGHMYSVIKDDRANIDAVCWRGTLGKLSVRPEEGLEVICTGKVSSYPARSNYQLIIDHMELAGEGALLKMLEERKKRLASEGLFDSSKKKKIPFLPERIGVITSPTGAVIRDIMHRLNDRFPRHVFLWPVRVQGETAAAEIEKAIKGLDSLPEKHRPDVIILARGGGSLEDLMPFNEENLVRAIASCDLPIITAIGHETDTTLSDYASDLRAPTPTGAAEMAVPRRIDLFATVNSISDNLFLVTKKLLTEKESRLENLHARMGSPERILETQDQHLDMASHKLLTSFDKFVSGKREKAGNLSAKLRHPENLLREKTEQLSFRASRLETTENKLTTEPQQKLEHAARMLESLSFKSVLKRGFAIVRDEKGKPLSNASDIKPSQKLDLEFRDGHTRCVSSGK